MARNDIDYSTVQNMIEAARKEFQQSSGQGTSSGGTSSDLSFFGTQPISTRMEDGLAYVTLKVAVPAGIRKLRTVYERFTGAGPTVTVERVITDVDKEIPDVTRASGGLYTFEFGRGLKFNAQYGSPKLVAFMDDGSTVKNWPDDVPESPRLLTDYLPDSRFTLGQIAQPPSAPAELLILESAVDKGARHFRAYAKLRIYAPLTDAGAKQTWLAAGITGVHPRISEVSGGLAVQMPTHRFTDAELSQLDATPPDGLGAASPFFNRGYYDYVTDPTLSPGKRYSWDFNVAITGNEKVDSSTTAILFYGGDIVTPTAGIPELSAATVTGDNTNPNDGVNTGINLNFTQRTPVGTRPTSSAPTNLPVYVQGCQLKRDGITVKDDVKLNSYDYHTPGVHTAYLGHLRTKKLTNNAITVSIWSYDATGAVVTRDVSLTLNPGDWNGGDTAPPTLASPSLPDVQEIDGHIYITCPTPTANLASIDEYQVVMSTQNTAPAATPSVGSEGVQKIKKGQAVGFRPKRPQDVTLYFYYRVHNSINYSSWSSGTSLSVSGISRPIDDFIGTAVPTLAIGLERSNTGGSSGNTTTTYYLDSGASSIVNDYVGSGENVWVLHIPSLAAGDRVRTITAYDEVNKRVTISPAWSSAPANGLAFEIHRGVIRGQSGGTQVDATHFILDASANSVNGHYSGMSIYTPSAAAADQIRVITGYTGSTKSATVDTTYSGTPANGLGYIIVKGNFGYANSDQTGIITGIPARLWLDTPNDVAEMIPPTGVNAFSFSQVQVQVVVKSGGAKKYDQPIAASQTPTFPWTAVSGGRSFRVRFQNLFRAGGSDGWSDWSYWADVPKSTSTNVNYNPDSFTPVMVDYEQDANRPSRYSIY